MRHSHDFLPGWAAVEVSQILASPLAAPAAERAIRAVLRPLEKNLMRAGWTSGTFARELVVRRVKP